MPVKDYYRAEPRTVAPGESIQDAATRMDTCGVGSLVVVDGQERPVGMLTDRDIVLAVARRRLDAEATPVREIMHEPVVTVTGEAPVSVAIRFLRQYSLRRLPVVSNETGKLEGILAADDVVQLLANELSGAAELIRSQFPGERAGEHVPVMPPAEE